MPDTKGHVIDLLFGRWHSQTLSAGVERGGFDVVGSEPIPATEISDRLDLDSELGYRLLRAVGSLGLLEEYENHQFSITPAGELLGEDHPESRCGVSPLKEGSTHYALWKHLPDRVLEGDGTRSAGSSATQGSIPFSE